MSPWSQFSALSTIRPLTLYCCCTSHWWGHNGTLNPVQVAKSQEGYCDTGEGAKVGNQNNLMRPTLWGKRCFKRDVTQCTWYVYNIHCQKVWWKPLAWMPLKGDWMVLKGDWIYSWRPDPLMIHYSWGLSASSRFRGNNTLNTPEYHLQQTNDGTKNFISCLWSSEKQLVGHIGKCKARWTFVPLQQAFRMFLLYIHGGCYKPSPYILLCLIWNSKGLM